MIRHTVTCVFLVVFLPEFYCQRNVTIGFLIDVTSMVNSSLLLAWGDTCCENVSVNADVDVQTIDPAVPFETQVETYITTSNRDVTVVVPTHCDCLPSLNSVAAAASGRLVAMTPLYCWTGPSLRGGDGVPPSLVPLVTAIHNFITQAKWNEGVIYHDHAHESVLSAILHMVTEVTFKPINITGMSDNKLLSIMVSTHTENSNLNQYLLLCDLSGITQVLSQARKIESVIEEQGFIDYYSQWLLLSEHAARPAILPLIANIHNLDVIVLRPLLGNVDLADFVSTNLDALKYEIEDIVIGRGLLTCSGVDCLHMSVVPPVDPASAVYTIYGAWETITGGGSKSLSWNQVATWNEASGLTVQTISLYPASSYGFNNKRLKIGTIDRLPYMIVNTSATATADRYKGFCMALINELSNSLNFSYDIVIPTDNSIGILNRETNTWNGLVKMLANKEIDLAVAPMAITKERSHSIDFTYPYHVDQFAILYKRINSASMKWRLMAEPFKWPVWCGVIFSVFVVAMFVWITSRFTPFYTEQHRRDGLGKKGYALFYTYGALMQQGCVYEPRAFGARFVVGFWWFYCMCVIATYQGNLIAFLTVPIEFLPFSSINELIYSSKFNYGFIGNTGLESVLENATDKLFVDMWKKVQDSAASDPTVMDTNVSKHISRVLSDGDDYAFFSDTTILQQSISEYCGNLNLLDYNIWMVQYAIAFPTGSTYPRLFSDLILQYHEIGLIDTWRVRYFKKEAICTKSESLAKSVTTDDIFGPLIAFVFGVVICLIILAAEHYWRYRQRKKDPQRTSSADSQSKIVDGSPAVADNADPATLGKSYPSDHDLYSVDPELLARKDYYYGLAGRTDFDGVFYSSQEFQRKVSDIRESYNDKNRVSSTHGSSTSRASKASRPSRAKNRDRAVTRNSVISPVESPVD